MEESLQNKTDGIVRIGPDQVTIREQEVVIEARRAMPDWEVRDLNPIPIYFEEKKFYLIEKRKAAPPYQIQYLLQPWPEGNVSNTKLFYTYDAETVQEREANQRTDRMDETIRAALLPLYPFLGLLWSGTQNRLTRFGFIPHSITGISIFASFCLLFAEGTFTAIMINASARSGKMMIGGLVRALMNHDYLGFGPMAVPVWSLDCFLLLALLVDVPVRYSHHFRESEWAGGFLEWLMPAAWRGKK